MPMHVSIPLLAAKRQNVDPFGRDHVAQRFGDMVNHPLKRKIVLYGKIPRSLLTVVSGSHQGVAIQRRVLVQKNNRRLVLINHVMGIGTGNQLADKTGTVLRTLFVGTNVKWLGTKHSSSPHTYQPGILQPTGMDG